MYKLINSFRGWIIGLFDDSGLFIDYEDGPFDTLEEAEIMLRFYSVCS